MITQIMFGTSMVVIGLFHLLNINLFFKKQLMSLENRLDKKKIKLYRKVLSIPYFLIGILIITMAYIEKLGILSVGVYLGLYIPLAALCIYLIIYINKKYTEYSKW